MEIDVLIGIMAGAAAGAYASRRLGLDRAWYAWCVHRYQPDVLKVIRDTLQTRIHRKPSPGLEESVTKYK